MQSILDGNVVDVDDGFLEVSAFSQQIQEIDDFVVAGDFFNSMLADSDDVGFLLDSISFLEVSAFSQQIQEIDDFVVADDFFNSMLADSDNVGLLLDSIGADGPGHVNISLDLDYDLFNSFLKRHNISENILFSSAFAYTLSRFVGSEKVLFNIIDNGRDRFQ